MNHLLLRYAFEFIQSCILYYKCRYTQTAVCFYVCKWNMKKKNEIKLKTEQCE